MTTFFRLTDKHDKRGALLDAVKHVSAGVVSDGEVFDFDAQELKLLPGAPFAYWLPSHLRARIRDSEQFESGERTALQGLVTGDDFRFVRLWWECQHRSGGLQVWFPFVKGGRRAPLYSDVVAVVRYDRAGQVGIASVGRFGRGASHYYRAGMSWPLRGVRFAAYAVPEGCIFGVGGKMAFAPSDQITGMLGLFNGSAFDAFLRIRAGKVGGVQYEAGLLKRVPVVPYDPARYAEAAGLADRGWLLGHMLDSVAETSHAFVLPAALRGRVSVLDRDLILAELRQIERELDDCSYSMYGLSDADRDALESAASNLASEGEEEGGGDDTDDLVGDSGSDARQDVQSLLSWCVGVSFGRFDIRIALGRREPLAERKMFEPLSERSPAMLDGHGVDVFVDDPGHSRDLVERLTMTLAQVGLSETADLRVWLARGFFSLHLDAYARSGRKAPIYWQLATPSASYSVWLYIHAFTKDTFFHVHELVVQKVEHEQRKLEQLRIDLKDASTSTDRKALAAQETLVEELRGMLDEVKRVKPLWKPDLDDGVVINFAPLWRLVPHHKAWQKELKATWDALCAGEYDWAHLAMHLWPERVVPKCVTDRSFAIAHGLEDVFWFEDSDGKWKPRPKPTRSVSALVAERTSAAVRAARDSLVGAPTPGGGSGKTRRKRATGPRRRR